MSKILINSHSLMLGYEIFHFNEEFNTEALQRFLHKRLSGSLVEFAGQTFLRSIPPVENLPVNVKIVRAYKNQHYWFCVFELDRPLYKKFKGAVCNTFVYKQGDNMVYSVCESGQGPATALEGELIYSCEE